MAANGYLQGIRGGMFTGDAQAQALETVWRSLQEITSLTHDILFMQEMELILPEFHPTHILAVILAAIEQEQPLAERIGVSVLLHTEPDLPLIAADPKSLQRALAAILDNAIKFSPEGGEVNVSITRAGAEPSADLYITIVDQGVGIPPEAMPRIFQRFFHLDIICGRVFRGIGLGLSIARHVIEQHHGTVEVQSQLEKGSTFRVRIPIRQA
jgi:signal transduction histidine kinase